MARWKTIDRGIIVGRLSSLVLVLLLPLPGWAQPVSPAFVQAAQAAHRQEKPKEAEISPPLAVDQNLVGKKVKVHLRDGRTLKGKLVELGRDFLRLQRRGQVEQVPLSEVRTVIQRRSTARRTWIIIGVSAAAVGLFLLIGARTIQD